MNVEQFAQELKLPPLLLLEQLKAAGVSKNDVADTVTEADKSHLLDYLRKVHGGGAETSKTKITITRKQTGEIRKTDSTGKSRTIQVEIRKSRTYVKRDVAATAAEAQPVAEAAPKSTARAAGRRDASTCRRNSGRSNRRSARTRRSKRLKCRLKRSPRPLNRLRPNPSRLKSHLPNRSN